jgi:hypothetical protein
MISESAYISTREAAQLLGISLRTAQLWVESNVRSWHKRPKGVMVALYLSSVKQIIEERERRSIDPTLANSSKLKVAIVEDDQDLLRVNAPDDQAYRCQLKFYRPPMGLRV